MTSSMEMTVTMIFMDNSEMITFMEERAMTQSKEMTCKHTG